MIMSSHQSREVIFINEKRFSHFLLNSGLCFENHGCCVKRSHIPAQHRPEVSTDKAPPGKYTISGQELHSIIKEFHNGELSLFCFV